VTSSEGEHETVIDVHSHLLPPAVIDELKQHPRVFPGIEATDLPGGAKAFRFQGLPDCPPMPASVLDVDRRVQWLDEEVIDVQLCAPWTDLFGYTLDPKEASAWSRFYNEQLVALATTRLVPVATVPLQAPSAAVHELELARSMGCVGVMIGTRTPAFDLDAEALDEFWEAAAALHMPVVVHPIFLEKNPRLDDYGLRNAVGRANETLIALSRLLLAGTILRHRGLTVLVAHGGAGLPSLLGRLHRNYEQATDELADPIAGFRRLYFDSVVIDPRVLRDLVALAGEDQVLMGSDYPFRWEPHPRKLIEDADPEHAWEAAVLGRNARRLFGL